jgi:hypothetical protein
MNGTLDVGPFELIAAAAETKISNLEYVQI